MVRWQYDRIALNSAGRKTTDLDLLNQAGEEGWELVQITVNNLAYLRRPIAPEPKTRKSAKPVT